MRPALALGALALALAPTVACRTIETRKVTSSSTPLVHIGAPARWWEVRGEVSGDEVSGDTKRGGELLGLVVLFQERGFSRDSIYLVRNPWQQDLGLIDGLGRAYRYVPHREEPAWVGSGTIAQGVERILALSTPCDLVEIDARQLDPEAGIDSLDAARPAASPAPVRVPETSMPPSASPPPDEGLAPAPDADLSKD